MPPKKVIFTEMKNVSEATEDIAEQQKPMAEQYYIEAMQQLKTKYDEIEYFKVKLTMQNTDLKKELCAAYGCVRMLDNLIKFSPEATSNFLAATACSAFKASPALRDNKSSTVKPKSSARASVSFCVIFCLRALLISKGLASATESNKL